MQRFLSLILVICICLSGGFWIAQSTIIAAEQTSWVNPAAMALKRVSTIPGAQHESVLLNNVDCQLLTYRLVSSSTMRSGCFSPTAFGLMDSDSGTVIFNGTDEGVPLIPKANGHVLVPWQNASTLIVLDGAPTGGSYVYLYSSPLASMQDERNVLFQLTAKRLVAPPDIKPKDAANHPLTINAGTLAISDGGSWLVAETRYGSFVRINLTTLDVKPFAPAYATGGLSSRVAVSDDGRYVAIQNKNASEFKTYDLSNCTANTCVSYNYQPFITTKVGGTKSINHLRFVNRDLLSFEVTTTNGEQSGVYQLAPRATITSMTDYIGLGDSYTSGEGAFDYRDGTDTELNSCHTSVHSYPMLLTKDLFTSLGGHSVACSGARINDITSNSNGYRGQIRNGFSLSELQKDRPEFLESIENNYLPGYVTQHRFVKRWQPKAVTVSIGGNDIGFGDLLERCVMPHVSRHHSDNVCFNTYEDRVEITNLIDRTVDRWTGLFKQLRSDSPEAQIYAIGYPDIIDDTGNCAINVNLGKSELEFAKELVVYINQGIKQAADAADVPYVDISNALVGHRLCEAKSPTVAVNGLTAGRDAFVFGRESYHPNALGHQLIEQAILRKTNNLSLRFSDNAPQNTPNILNASKSGRVIFSRQPETFTNTVQHKTNTTVVRLGGSLLKPNATYSIHLNGPAGQVIGTIISDGQGNINSSAAIPNSANTGPGSIDITGEGPSGEQIDITQPIYIPESEDDVDNDGVPNVADSCPAAANSGQDTDQDSIDDVCDSLITDPPGIDIPPASEVNPSEPSPGPNPATPQDGGTIPPNGTGSATLQDPSPPSRTEENSNTSTGGGDTLQVSTVKSTNIHGLVALSVGNMNNKRGVMQVISTTIYRGQGVVVNNLGHKNIDNPAGNSDLQKSERTHYINPTSLGWLYMLSVPFILWGTLRLVLYLCAVRRNRLFYYAL